MNVAYAGPPESPELGVLESRDFVEVQIVEPSQLAETGADAAVLALDDETTITHATRTAEAELPFYVRAPVESAKPGRPGKAGELAGSVQSSTLITGAGSLYRYAINVIQVMQTVKQQETPWASFRLFAPSIRDAFGPLQTLCDLARFVCGEVGEISTTSTAGTSRAASLAMERAAVVEILAVDSYSGTPIIELETVAGGRHLAWDSRERLLAVDWSSEYNVADKSDGFHLAALNAFLTGVREGTESPILSTFPDAVRSLELAEELRRAWNIATEDTT